MPSILRKSDMDGAPWHLALNDCFPDAPQYRSKYRTSPSRNGRQAQMEADQSPSLARCSSHSAGGSTARSNSVTWFGNASSRMAATMSGASVVKLTIRLT